MCVSSVSVGYGVVSCAGEVTSKYPGIMAVSMGLVVDGLVLLFAVHSCSVV